METINIQQTIGLVGIFGFLARHLIDHHRQLLDFFRVEVAHDLIGQALTQQDR